jgi:hypothetical protein
MSVNILDQIETLSVHIYKYPSKICLNYFAKKLVLPKNFGKTFNICEKCKLQIFEITNICKPIFVTFGRLGTRYACRTIGCPPTTFTHKIPITKKDALANRSSGIISAFGVMGREIESRQYKELCLRMYVALKNHDILSNRRKLATVPTIVTWK